MTTRRDISLNVVADISRYQQQFAKIPGYTDKQAAKAAQNLERRMSKAAADSARAAERAAKAAARVEFQEAKKRAAALKEVEAIQKRATDQIERQNLARMSASERAIHALNQEIAALERLQAEGADAAEVAKARAAVTAAGSQKIAAARARELADANMDAAKSADELGHATRRSRGQMRGAASGSRDLAGSLDHVAETSGDVDSILAGLGGALGAIDPKLQEVTTGFADAAGGIEAVSKAGLLSLPALATVGVAAAGLGAAYLILANDAEEAAEKQEAAAKKAAAAQLAFNGFTKAIRELDVEVQKLVGAYDEIEVAATKREEAFNKQAAAARRYLETEIAATKQEQARLRGLQQSGDASDETTAALTRANQQLSRQSGQLTAVIARTERFRAENELLTEELKERRDAEAAAALEADRLAAADEAASRAAERAAAAQAKQKAQIDAIVEAGRKRSAQVERDIALQQQNAAIVQQATAIELSAMGEIAKAAEDQLKQAEEIRAQRIENARGDAFLQLQAEEEYQTARSAIVAQYEQERTDLMVAQAEEQARITEEKFRGFGISFAEFSAATLGALNSTFAGMSQLAQDAKSKQQARQLFQAAKVTGIGLAITNTAVAATKALAQFGPIGGPLAAAAMTAAGLVQIETIRRQKPPEFYRGTSMVEPAGATADAVPATLHAGEAVLNRRAADAMGRSQIEALNAGRQSSSPQVVAISQINHRQFRSFYRDDRSLPGSLTRRDRNRNGTQIGRQL